jgi:regulator of ribonuclease activity A
LSYSYHQHGSNMSISTSGLVDRHPDLASCETQFRIFGRRRAFQGRIRTIRCRGDNALIRTAFAAPSAGLVLVVDGAGSFARALLGDNMARLAMQNGWEGVVVNGVVRDGSALQELDFCIKALGTNPLRPTKTGDGEVDVPVSFGGVDFVRGHWLYSDDDGILLSPLPLHE